MYIYIPISICLSLYIYISIYIYNDTSGPEKFSEPFIQDLLDELPREAVSLKALAEVNDVEAALKRLGSTSKNDMFE